jgi:hypothetical protein
MMNHEENNNHLTISHELLLLLRWLVTHDENRLKKIIQKAVNTGLHNELHECHKRYTQESEEWQELQYSVGDFFNMLELLLAQAVDEKINCNAQHDQLSPALDQIDSTLCDTNIVRSSLEKASMLFAKNPEKNNAKEILFHELLKNWKPTTKIMN